MLPRSFSRNPFSRPFPDREFDRGTVMGLLRISLFVTIALLVLRPVGVEFGDNALAIAAGYGVVTFLVAVTYQYVTQRLFGWRKAGRGWTLGMWMLDCALLLAFISAGNFLFYNFLVGWTALSGYVLAYIAVPTTIIGLFPIAFSGMAIQMRAERDHQRTAGQVTAATQARPVMNTPPAGHLVSLTEDFALDPATIVFCEARQNYVRVVYLEAGVATEATIRATLTEVARRTEERGNLLRCHRSYLVNPEFVAAARGNAQGLRLRLVGVEEEVPVSRTYVPTVRAEVTT